MKSYKGYTISNISDDASKPYYGIFDKDGKKVSTTPFGSTGLKDFVDGLNKKEKKTTKKITESQLRKMISESVNRVLKESLNISLYDRVDKIREYLGDDGFIEALLRCMSDDELEDHLDFIESQYDIEQFGEDDEI